MKVVYKIADNIISSLGITTAENMSAIGHGVSGIGLNDNLIGVPEPFYASAIDFGRINSSFKEFADIKDYTPFERIVILSIKNATVSSGMDLSSKDTLFILSTTKGNISLLEKDSSIELDPDRIQLWQSAKLIAGYFKNSNSPVVISQACISGVSAILTAKAFLESGRFKKVVVAGGDVLSKFVVSGFQSFKALSPTVCKPFDASRDGLSLGEGAATLVLGISREEDLASNTITIKAGATSNDANHISGPSRTGEGLFRAISDTLNQSGSTDLAFINAHGTATPFNDEMEAVAISRARLEHIPVNSYKGYIGHTLGAAGIIETIICCHSLQQQKFVKSLGFNVLGVSGDIKVIREAEQFKAPECLKLASGFGGCNAVVHLKKHN